MKYIGVNGVLTEAADAVIHVSDHGFLYGMGLFETFRTYKGVPFLLDRHLNRLAEGCQMLGIPFQPDKGQLTAHVQSLMAANSLNEAYIRYTVSAGEEVLGLPSGDYTRPNHILFAKPLPATHTETVGTTVASALQLLRTPRNTPEGEIRLKSLHYMNNILAKRELQQYAAAVQHRAEGMMLTADGFLAEGMVSNLFLYEMIRCTPRSCLQVSCQVLHVDLLWSWRKREASTVSRVYTVGTSCGWLMKYL